jgi:hypothetical protein
MNIGSLDSLKVSWRWGLRPNAFQIRPTVDPLRPDLLAIEARDQCVASFGVDSRVSVRTFSTCSSLTFRGAPGRGSSASPSSRSATNRERHLPTVARATPNRPATSVLAAPVAHSSTMRHRSASCWALVGRAAQRRRVSRSSSVSSSSAFGRPGSLI